MPVARRESAESSVASGGFGVNRGLKPQRNRNEPSGATQRRVLLRRVAQIHRANELIISRPGCTPVWIEAIVRKQRETIAKLASELEGAL